jgi:hypothetical protein
MGISGLGGNAPAWGSSHQSVANKEWLGYRLNCLDLFAHRNGEGRNSNWAAIESVDQS